MQLIFLFVRSHTDYKVDKEHHIKMPEVAAEGGILDLRMDNNNNAIVMDGRMETAILQVQKEVKFASAEQFTHCRCERKRFACERVGCLTRQRTFTYDCTFFVFLKSCIRRLVSI